MATIAALTGTRLSVPLHTPFVTSLRRTTTTETLVVRVVDSDGTTGWGEAPQVWQVTGESLASAAACVEQMLAPLVVGRDVDDWPALVAAVQRAVARNFGAKAAVDVALHDLVARRSGVPLASLLAGPAGGPTGGPTAAAGPDGSGVRTDVTLSAGSADDLAAAAVQRVADGFSVLKMKVGTDATTDVTRVRAVREAVGSDVTIRLDANQGWAVDAAVEVILALERADLGVELVEQPVAGEDVEGLARVRARVGLPVMADEAVYSLVDLDRVARLGAADLVNVKLAKCGSLGAALALLRRATEHGLGTMVGSMMESPIGVGAIASVAVAHPTTVVDDLDAAWWAAASPVEGGSTYRRDTLVLPAGAGLGVSGLVPRSSTPPRRTAQRRPKDGATS